eukprot:Skav235521  [mRNA]  locus=scaffold625:1005043:1008354:+ [translate_table: standard]
MPDLSFAMTISEWKFAVKRTKPSTSRGICGFSQPELAHMCDSLIEVILANFNSAVKFGLPRWMLTSKVHLIPKTQESTRIRAMRPITVFSLLYRTWSKAVARRLLQCWSSRIPTQIVGALPGRSCVTLSLKNAIFTERYIHLGCDAGGYSLDITKCFNAIGRRPTYELFLKGGMCRDHADFWFHSLGNMSRTAIILSSYSETYEASTGLPEGDPASVLGMILIGYNWSELLKMEGLRTSVFADDWTWDGESVNAHIRAMQLTDRFLRCLRLTSDPSKCWAWGATPKARKMWGQISLELTGDPKHIQITTAEKALGVCQHFSKATQHGCQTARLDKGLERLERLSKIPTDIDNIAKLIQSNVWAMSFFGSDTVYIGNKHYKSFRSIATKALVTKTKATSTLNACSLLSKYMVDPFFYVLFRCLMNWKRLMTSDPASSDVIKFVLLQASDDPVHAFGPASILNCYLKILGWTLLADGSICDHLDRPFSLTQIPAAHLNNFLWDAWDKFLTDHIRKRKGLQLWPEIDALQTRKVALPTDNRERAIIANLRCIGTMWADQREKWTEVCNGDELSCPLCGASDAREHFPFECPGTEELRLKHRDAIEKTKTDFPHLCFLPVIHKHPKHQLLQMANFSRTLPEPFDPHIDSAGNMPLNFFTDGSCIFPEQGGRLSTFAIIQDCCLSDNERIEQAIRYKETGMMPSSLKVAQVGMTCGPQTINRAEFTALIQIVASCIGAQVYCDSAWSIDAFGKVQSSPCAMQHFGSSNDDLLQILCSHFETKDPSAFCLHKIAAHRDDSQAISDLDLYYILGNRVADNVAREGVKPEISPIHQICWDVGNWYKNQHDALVLLMPFLAQAEMLRLDAFDKKTKQLDSEHGKLFSEQRAITWDPIAEPLHSRFVVPDEVLASFLPGASVLQLAVDFLTSLQWPSEPTPGVSISWYELTVNFIGSTKLEPPRICNRGEQFHKYLDPLYDDSAILLPLKVWDVVRLLDNAAAHIHRLMNIELVPYAHAKVRWHLGFMGYKNKVSGFNLRPCLPFLDTHLKVLRDLVTHDGLGIPVPFSVEPNILRTSCPLDMNSFEDRYKAMRRETRLVKTAGFYEPLNSQP